MHWRCKLQGEGEGEEFCDIDVGNGATELLGEGVEEGEEGDGWKGVPGWRGGSVVDCDQGDSRGGSMGGVRGVGVCWVWAV